MPHAHRSVIFFIVFSCIFFRIDANQNENKSDSVPVKELRRKNNISDQQSSQQNQPYKNTQNFTQTEVDEIKLMMPYSPLEALLIIEHLKNPQFFPNNEDYRSVVFVGEPGSGKTTMAKAIAYYMLLQGWEYTFIPSSYFLGEYRNQAAVKLQRELHAIEASGRPTILIIDELNQLLENTDSSHHDTDATSKTLWTFLDKQAGNDQFFFIGTMNRLNKLPKPFKDRILFDYIEFPLIDDLAIKKEIFHKYLTMKNTKLDDAITDTFLHESMIKMGPCPGRDLKKISSMICRINCINNKENHSVIKKESISTAINEYVKRKNAIQYDLIEETEEERQERHHKESMQMQKEHFIQQQFIQIAMNKNQESLVSRSEGQYYSKGSTISAEGREEIDSLISDEQRELYNTMMATTRQREKREAEKKAQEEAIKAKAEAIRKAKADEESKKWFWQR